MRPWATAAASNACRVPVSARNAIRVRFGIQKRIRSEIRPRQTYPGMDCIFCIGAELQAEGCLTNV